MIVRLGDAPINRFDDLQQTLAQQRPGDTVGIRYLRDGADHLTSATLDARP